MDLCSDDEQRGEIVWNKIKQQFGVSEKTYNFNHVDNEEDILDLSEEDMDRRNDHEGTIVDGRMVDDSGEIVNNNSVPLKDREARSVSVMAVDSDEDSDLCERDIGQENISSGKMNKGQWVFLQQRK